MLPSSQCAGPLSYNDLQTLTPPENVVSVVTLGTFDGVHIGHQTILQHAVKTKHALQQRTNQCVECVAFTFDRLPLETLRPDKAPKRLLSLEDRCHQLTAHGMDRVVFAKFDTALAQVSAEHYITDILCRVFHVASFVVGFNHTFGHMAQGNAKFLQSTAAKYDMPVEIVDQIAVGDTVVSSTFIRQALYEGRCQQANELLGRPFQLAGLVVDGAKRGRLLGYPTANIQPAPNVLVPGDGVYFSRVRLHDEQLGYALTVISNRPTFGQQDKAIEVHLLQYEGDLYNKTLRIDFLDFVRPINHFPSAEALKQQIQQDIEQAMQRTAEFE